MRKSFFVLFFISFLALGASVTFAAETITLDLNERTARLYSWSLGVGSVLALGILIYAGFLYSVSAGNASRIKDAKAWIVAGLLGLSILLGSYLLLSTINPDLTNLESILLKVNIKQEFTPPEITFGGGHYFAAPSAPICKQACLADPRNREQFCATLPDCAEKVCPFGPRDPGLNERGVWLVCRPSTPKPGLTGAVCPWNVGQGCSSDHSGIDLAAPEGVPVYALESGTVVAVVPQRGPDDKCGNYLKLVGDSGLSYGYCHLAGWTSKMQSVLQGTQVRVVAGEQIAFNGQSGNAKGPHIHFSVLKSSCTEDNDSCQITPGCYFSLGTGKINPGPIIRDACGVTIPNGYNIPLGTDGPYATCPGGSFAECLGLGINADICSAECGVN